MESILIDLTPENTYTKLFEIKTQFSWRTFLPPHKGLDSLCPARSRNLSICAFYDKRVRSPKGPLRFLSEPGVSRQYLLSCLAAPRSGTPTVGLSLASFVRTSSASMHAFLTPRKYLPSGQNQPSFPFSPTLPDNNGLILQQPEPRAAFSKQSRTVANSTSWAAARCETNRDIIPSFSFLFPFMVQYLLSSSRQRAARRPKTRANILPAHIKTESLSYLH